jgi:hypothetical protein
MLPRTSAQSQKGASMTKLQASDTLSEAAQVESAGSRHEGGSAMNHMYVGYTQSEGGQNFAPGFVGRVFEGDHPPMMTRA